MLTECITGDKHIHADVGYWTTVFARLMKRTTFREYKKEREKERMHIYIFMYVHPSKALQDDISGYYFSASPARLWRQNSLVLRSRLRSLDHPYLFGWEKCLGCRGWSHLYSDSLSTRYPWLFVASVVSFYVTGSWMEIVQTSYCIITWWGLLFEAEFTRWRSCVSVKNQIWERARISFCSLRMLYFTRLPLNVILDRFRRIDFSIWTIQDIVDVSLNDFIWYRICISLGYTCLNSISVFIFKRAKVGRF